MIFLSVGGQLPFDRLISSFENWYRTRNLNDEVIIQCGSKGHVTLPFTVFERIPAEDFSGYVDQCDFMISHAGMGNIISCIERQKKGVFLSRKADFGEHRNDHQIDTVNSFSGQYKSLLFANTEDELFKALDLAISNKTSSKIEKNITVELHNLAEFIQSEIDANN